MVAKENLKPFTAQGLRRRILSRHRPSLGVVSPGRWQDQPLKAGLRRLYTELLEARRLWPALRNFSERAARLHHGPGGPVVLELVRGGVKFDETHTVQVFCNLTAELQTLPIANPLTLLISSESSRYGGYRVGRIPIPRNCYRSNVWPSDRPAGSDMA